MFSAALCITVVSNPCWTTAAPGRCQLEADAKRLWCLAVVLACRGGRDTHPCSDTGQLRHYPGNASVITHCRAEALKKSVIAYHSSSDASRRGPVHTRTFSTDS